jgi:NAD(P)-dependent dehydrogenase (short-subunit alcohol dehydrogenase family)
MNDRPIAVVTGASSGIGAATAVELARKGYTVYLAARREDRLHAVAEACSAAGGEGRVAPTDVTDRAQVEALVRRADDEGGRIDVMVNNAGYGVRSRLAETTEEQMRRIFDVNFFGVFFGCAAVAPVMIARRAGHIFNVSSVLGKRGSPFHGAYSATKHAVCGLTDSLRVEMLPYNVRVTAVCPGMTDTEFFDKVEGGSRDAESSFKTVRTRQPPEHVARGIVRAIGRNVPEMVFTPGGKLLALVSALWPRLADRMMKLYHDDLLRLERTARRS